MSALIRTPGAWLPIVISLAALAFLIGYVAAFGVASHADERAPARIFQALMLVEGLIVVWFAARWLPRAPRQTIAVLVVQLLVALVPIAAVLLLESTA